MTDHSTTLDVIADWFAGEDVPVIELGGLSPGYEIAIWETAFKILEDMIYAIDTDASVDWSDGTDSWELDREYIKELSDRLADEEGLSGAQTGAAVNAATVIFRHGFDKALDMVDLDRIVVINRGNLENPWSEGTDQHYEYAIKTGIGMDAYDKAEPKAVAFAPTYQLDCPKWPGAAKTVEEMGELGVVIGKLQSCGGLDEYPWGGYVFKEKLEEEIADVMACLFFMMDNCESIDRSVVVNRLSKKLRLFKEWAKGNHNTRFEDM